MRWGSGFVVAAFAVACGSSASGSAGQAGNAGAPAAGAGGASAAGASTTGGASGASTTGSTSGASTTGGTSGASTTGGTSGASTTGGDTTGGTSSAGAAGTTSGGHVLTGADGLTGFGPNDRCLPQGDSLPASSAASLTACRLIFTGVTGGCTQAGLSVATAQDKASVVVAAAATGELSVQEPECQLTQLAAHTGAECAAASDSGWCYADGACMAMSHTCGHALCATPAFNKLMLTYQLPSWLVCDGAQSSPR